MKKLFTFLLALAASVGASWAAPAVAVDGKLPGAFSVSATKVVYFSQGNLQATTADYGTTWTWDFAADQLTFVGYAVANTKINGNGTVSENGAVDFFCWSTAATKYGIHNNTTSSGFYTGDFVDWGSNTDLIASLGSGWRTLTKDEWVYLLNTRTTTSGVRYAKAKVDGKAGMIVLPDDWLTSYYALASTNTEGAAFTTNTIDAATWASDLEAHGAVFLPAVGYRTGTLVGSDGTEGYYWSATPDGADYAYQLNFYGSGVSPEYRYNGRYYGCSVRLVNETAPVTNPTVEINSEWWDNWTTPLTLTDNGNGTASATQYLNNGYCPFKVVVDNGWLGNGEDFKRDYTSASGISTNGDNMTLWVDTKGYYTFTWTYATNTLTITFSALPTVTMKGSWDSWADAVTFTDNGDGTASATKTFSEEGYYTFKTNIGTDDWRGNGYTFKRTYTGANWINDNGSDMIIYVDQTGDYTFTWTFVENAIAISFPTLENRSVSTNADPNNASVYYSTFYDSTNKYALTNDGTEAFVATLSEDKLSLTKIAEGTDVLPANTAVILRKSGSAEPVVLTPSDEEPVTFEAVNSLMGRDAQTPLAELSLTSTTCYVLSGGSVDEEVTGVGFYRIYGTTLKAHKAYVQFNGSVSSAPKRMRLVFPQEQMPTGLEETNATDKARKVMENGTLYIIRDGVRYYTTGQIAQ